MLLLAGRRNTVEDNQIYGNWNAGVALVEGIIDLDDHPEAVDLIDNKVLGNAFGLNGTDLNGRELAYDGNGSGNCFGGNTGVRVTIPANGSTLTPCDPAGTNVFDPAALANMLSLAGVDGVAHQLPSTHAPKKGYTPLVEYKK